MFSHFDRLSDQWFSLNFLTLRSCFGMIPEFYYADYPRQFRLRKRERSSSYVTDDEDENGRKGHVRKERNYSKTASNIHVRHFKNRPFFRCF